MKQRAGGPAQGEKLIIYNRGTGKGLKNRNEKCEERRKVNEIKNRSEQWEGPDEEELDGCIMHPVHTSVRLNE